MAFRRKQSYDGKIAGLYDLEETIGRGHFAVVKLARHVFTGERVAVKVIDKTKLDDVSRAHLFQEVRCMKLVQHPNVVRLYEVIDTQTKLYLILELGDGGDMFDYIMKHEKGLDENFARKYFRQIVQAIHYCHKLHVVHRDLKPENVVFFEKLGLVKLTDFGFSNKYVPGMKLETSCGSLAYSAPEILLGDSYDAPAVDIWSLGVLLFMLVCGEPPFQEANDSETLTMIMDCKYKLPPHVSQECHNLISRMLRREPEERANLEEISNHSWLTKGDPTPTLNVPLVSREMISDEDNEYIIAKMVEGNIASKEEILSSLEKDQYDHITATYYLLAERRLKRQLTMMATAISDNGPPQAPQHVLRRVASAGPGQLNLEPLALSPRIQESHVTQADMFKSAQLVDSLVSPITAHAPSPLTFTSTSGPGERRKFSLIREESGEEESETEMSEKLAMGGAEPMDVDFDKNYEVKMTKSLDEVSSDSDSRSGSETSLSRKALALRRPVTSRPTLRSVSSSPQLLNQIFEEGESDGDDDLIQPSDSSRPRVYNTQHHHHPLASPELLRKLGRMKKRRGSGQRGTSCSSSDASDTDDPDSKKRKEKLKHRFPRKDSSDTSSDTDGPGGFGGGPGGHGSASGPGGKGGGNPRRDRRDSDRKGGKDKGGGSSSSSKGSKNSKSGSKRAEHGPATLTDIPEQPKQAAQGKPSVSDAGKQQQAAGGTKNNHNLDNIPEQSGADSGQSLPVKAAANGAHHIRKSSNLSLASNISNLSLSSSLTSRSSKYVVDSNAGTPRTSRDEDDKGHKINARIIHVISREFSDIYERLSREGSLKEDNGSICSNDCSLRNNSQVKRRSKEKVKVDINSNGLRDKMVLNAGTTESKGGISVKKPVTKCCVLF